MVELNRKASIENSRYFLKIGQDRPAARQPVLLIANPSLPFFPEVTWQSVNKLMHFSGGEYDVLARQMDRYLNLFPPAAMVFCEPDGGFQRGELHGRCVGGPELHAAVRRTVI
ncbi:hypothetical protein FY112_04045 [Rhizobium sp. PEPV16]|nr:MULTISPECIES: hypothetical protein [Rhizobium]KAF5887213.1 hypothetical protein FY112_04045 [Rhizobium sp. PEPV16]